MSSDKFKIRFDNRMINTKEILALLLYLLTFHCNEVVETTQFKLLKGSGNTYKTTNIQRNEDLEYPRKDGKILKTLHRLWRNYYTCLKEKEKDVKKPELRRLLEGQNTEFKCDFCARPFQNYEEIQWKYKPLSPEANVTELDYLDLTPEMSLTTDKTLQVFNAMESFAGLYVCFHGKNVLSVYLLEVSKNDTTEKIQKLQTTRDKFEKFGYNFHVHYKWTNFTECSRCGKVGRKFKYGTCYVSQLPSAPKPKSSQATKYVRIALESSEELVRTKKNILQKSIQEQINRHLNKGNYSTLLDEDQNFEPEIVGKFETGIPCASPFLNKIESDFSKKYIAVKVIVEFCWEPCHENEIFEVLDNFGKVVEIANNSAGVYSLFQKLPNVPPGIERRTLVADFGSTVIIQCPGTSLTNAPVVWKVNDKLIYPNIISNESNGRFTIDLVNRIHIQRLRLKDGKIYSCWQKGRLIGTVHLNVEKKFKTGFNHHVTLIGIAAVIGTFLLVGSKMLTRELKMRKK